MKKTIEFLLLANSRKSMPAWVNKAGRCVAGIDLATGDFVRLVSNNEGDALEWGIFQDYKPGTVWSVTLDHKAPTKGAQTENWVIGSPIVKYLRTEEGTDWVKPYLSNGTGPFGDPFTYYYESRYEEKVGTGSLCVMTAYNVKMYGNVEGEGRKKVDFDFYYPGPLKIKKTIERMSLTDPFQRFAVLNGIGAESGNPVEAMTVVEPIKIDEAYLVVSLPGTPMVLDSGEKRYYKFVAAVIPASKK